MSRFLSTFCTAVNEPKKRNRLGQPVTIKYTEEHDDEWFDVACSSMQGWRPTMEDAHSIELSLLNHPDYAFFAVFDGHNGDRASKWCGQHIQECVDDLDEFNEKSLRQVILDADKKFCNTKDRSNGSTLCFALIKKAQDFPYNATVVNVGDSKCITGHALREEEVLTEDHKPTNAEEKSRIEAAGGEVVRGRVDGHLAMSRAIGDYDLKSNDALDQEEQRVIAAPDITHTQLQSGDFLLLACDGIFEALEPHAVVEFVGRHLRRSSAADTAEALLMHSLESGSQDNMTVILIIPKSTHDADRSRLNKSANKKTETAARNRKSRGR